MFGNKENEIKEYLIQGVTRPKKENCTLRIFLHLQSIDEPLQGLYPLIVFTNLKGNAIKVD